MTYYTLGLPNGTFPEKKYQFNINGNSMFVPGDYVGRDQMGEVHHIEQKIWINSLAPNINVKEVWYGTWEFASEDDTRRFILLLEQKSNRPDNGV